jgi:hypothetical protein
VNTGKRRSQNQNRHEDISQPTFPITGNEKNVGRESSDQQWHSHFHDPTCGSYEETLQLIFSLLDEHCFTEEVPFSSSEEALTRMHDTGAAGGLSRNGSQRYRSW